MELMDVLVQAMKLESDGRRFYETIAKHLSDPEAAAMFTRLAADEVDHYNYIERQYLALEAGKGWSEIPEMASVASSTRLGRFPARKAGFGRAAVQSLRSRRAALRARRGGQVFQAVPQQRADRQRPGSQEALHATRRRGTDPFRRSDAALRLALRLPTLNCSFPGGTHF